MQRDLYIDTIRGICVVSIIFIHTVFYSVASFTPDWIRNISLLMDVPLFFFLSGCTMAIYPKFDPLKQIFKLAILFFAAIVICRIIFLEINLKSLLAPLVLGGANVSQLQIIQYSYWFIPIYAVGILWAKIMTNYLRGWIINICLILVPVFYCYLYFSHKIFLSPKVLEGVSVQMFLFPLWLILLGYKTYKCDIKLVWFGLSFISFAILLLIMLTHVDFYLQNYKFPISLPYIIASMISLGLVMGFKRTVKNNIFAEIGQKAIYFYLSQGISSSVLCRAVFEIFLPWALKLLFFFFLNCSMALLLGKLIFELEPKITSFVIKKSE